MIKKFFRWVNWILLSEDAKKAVIGFKKDLDHDRDSAQKKKEWEQHRISNAYKVIVEDEDGIVSNLDVFGKLTDDQKATLVFIDKDKDMWDVLVGGKFFVSKSQAKKAGWIQEIPLGLNEYTIGKLKKELWIYKPYPYNPDDDLIPKKRTLDPRFSSEQEQDEYWANA